MKTTVIEATEKRLDEELEKTMQRIVERAQVLYSNDIKMVRETRDVESANSDDRFYIMFWKTFLGFPTKEEILLTVPRRHSMDECTCWVQDPAILEIATEEMQNFCEKVGKKNLVIKKTY